MKSKKEINPLVKEILTILIVVVILTLSINYGRPEPNFFESAIIFAIILFVSFVTKKLAARYYELSITTKLWEISQFGFKEKSRFKKPLAMVWFPFLSALIIPAGIWFLRWLPILEFDVKAKPERATRKHGLYQFAEVNENHMAYIAFWSIMAVLASSLIGYLLGFGLFAKIGVSYALWSLIPISRLDGSKLFFGEKGLWFLSVVICLIFFVGVLLI